MSGKTRVCVLVAHCLVHEAAHLFMKRLIWGQWKFSGDKHKSLQVDTERTFHQRYLLVML